LEEIIEQRVNEEVKGMLGRAIADCDGQPYKFFDIVEEYIRRA